jgi:hypothetical protein
VRERSERKEKTRRGGRRGEKGKCEENKIGLIIYLSEGFVPFQ